MSDKTPKAEATTASQSPKDDPASDSPQKTVHFSIVFDEDASDDDTSDGLSPTSSPSIPPTASTAASVSTPPAVADAPAEVESEGHDGDGIASHLDRELSAQHDDDILLKSYPTFAMDHVTLRDRKSGHNVLDDVQASFYARKLYAIVTNDDDQRKALLSILSGFQRPDKGQVMLKSTDLATLLPSEIRGHHIGLVPQRFALRDDLDATANIVYTMDSIDRTFLKPKPELAHELLTLVGFTGAATGEPVGRFSPLDQRRIAIARAIACEATAIVIDAPTADLDDEGSSTILQLLTRLAHTGETARCVVMVTTSQDDIDAADRYFEL